MTLDEAIRHANEVARTCDDSQCAADLVQLAEWLRRARGAESAARWYTGRIRELEDESRRLAEENERLRNENTRLNAKMSTRLHGINAADVKRYHDASDGLCMEECKRILVEQAREGENARLRELAHDMYKILSALDIDYCGPCPQDNVSHPCPRYTIYGGDCKFETAMRELGIEVDE